MKKQKLAVQRPVVKFPSNLRDVWEAVSRLTRNTPYTLWVNWQTGTAHVTSYGSIMRGICVYANISYRHMVKKVYTEYAAIMAMVDDELSYESEITVQIDGQLMAKTAGATLIAGKYIQANEILSLSDMSFCNPGEPMQEVKITVFSRFLGTGETAVYGVTNFWRWLDAEEVKRHYTKSRVWQPV